MQSNYPGNQIHPMLYPGIDNSLEEIVFNGNNKKENNLLGKMFSDKTNTLKATVKALLDEIKLRENLGLQLHEKLDKDICRFDSDLLNFNSINTYYDFDKFLNLEKIRQKIENNVLDLKSEKRKEYLECWRDLMFLKKYLMSALKEYWEVVKRREVLGE